MKIIRVREKRREFEILNCPLNQICVIPYPLLLRRPSIALYPAAGVLARSAGFRSSEIFDKVSLSIVGIATMSREELLERYGNVLSTNIWRVS